MLRAEDLGQLGGISPAERLAKIAHQAFEVIQVGQPARADGTLILAGVGPLAVDAPALHQPLQLGNRRAVERQQALLVGRIRMFQGKFVRQVDDEA